MDPCKSPGQAGQVITTFSASRPNPANTGFSTRRSKTSRSNGRSCVTCSRRKTKCDKKLPCSGCQKLGFECDYPSPRPTNRKAKFDSRSALKSRLDELETLVKGLDKHVGHGEPRTKSSAAGDVVEEMKTVKRDLGRLVIEDGFSRYMENSFWEILSDKVSSIRNLLENYSEDDGDADLSSYESSLVMDHEGFIFRFNSLASDLKSFHPIGNNILFLWTVFVANVDPLVRLLHKPTMHREVVNMVLTHATGIEPPVEALLFAIYFASVTSLSPDECRSSLGGDKDTLLSRYRFAVQQALARANFLVSRSAITLQALIIYLACERSSDDSNIVWPITGVAFRIAQSLGIHRDGTTFNLSPFEIEIRRRCWWQLCLLDIRNAENYLFNQDIAEQKFDTKFPLNIDDEALDSTSVEPPAVETKFTETTLSLARYEIVSELRRLRSKFYIPGNLLDGESYPSLREIDRATDDLKGRLEEKYLKHCNAKLPFHWFMIVVARMMVARMWICVHHPVQLGVARGSLPDRIKDRLFIVSLDIVEAWLLLQSETKFRKWRWAFQNYVPWQALAFILLELCIRTGSDANNHAWAIAGRAFEEWTKLTADKKRDFLWLRMRKLMAITERSRAAVSAKASAGSSTFPQTDTSNAGEAIWLRDWPLGPQGAPFQESSVPAVHAVQTAGGDHGKTSHATEQQDSHLNFEDDNFMSLDFDNPFDLVRWANEVDYGASASEQNVAIFEEIDNWW